MKTNIVIDISPPILWAEMMSANQIPEFFKIKYLKKGVNDKVYFWHADKNGSSLQVDTFI